MSACSLCIEAEVVAGRPRPCGKTEFTCSNRRCVPLQLQCDLFSDCGDGGSDEQDCKACKCSAVKLSEQIKIKHSQDETYRMSPWCYREAQQSPHFKCDVLLFMVIYVWPCLRCGVNYMKDDDALLGFAHQKKNTAKSEKAEGLMCNQSRVFISSFQWRCLWEENKSMWRGCNLQPDIC